MDDKTKDDQGHKNLIDDLTALLREAEIHEFHDYENTNYATPKMVLREKLLTMAQNVIEGRYDN